ncbi:MAG: hypothetical protein ACI867_000605, partial [Glaciecola sp.]
MKHPHGQDGAALMMALLFLLLFAIAVPALLGLSFSSLRFATAAEDRGRAAYASDGAIDSVIANLRASTTLGAEGGPACGGTIDSNSTSILVRCTPQSGSGAVTTTGGGAGNSANTPAQAIMIAGTDAGEIGLDKTSTGNVKIGGAILSHSTVTVQSPSVLSVTGEVRARLGCDAARIVATGPVNCAAPDFAVPSWPSELTALPAKRTAPACTSG